MRPRRGITRLHTETVVPASVAETFAFFSDAANLERLTPPWLNFRILTPLPVAMGEGAEIRYRIVLYGIPLPWTTRIDVWEPGVRFVDRQTSGPYVWWRHEHRFEAVPGGTRVVDEVEYMPRLRWLTQWKVGRDVARIFGYRAEALKTLFVLCLAALVCIPACAAPADAAQPPLRVVPTVDYARYAGRWFEIARLPNWFEKSCVADVTAEYTPADDGRLNVVNRCRKADGTMKSAKGIARRVDGRPPSVLQVRFAPAFLSWFPKVWGDYQILSLADDYSTVLIGTPDRKYLWIMARTAALDAATYDRLVAEARSQGFEVERLLRVTHQGPATGGP